MEKMVDKTQLLMELVELVGQAEARKILETVRGLAAKGKSPDEMVEEVVKEFDKNRETTKGVNTSTAKAIW